MKYNILINPKHYVLYNESTEKIIKNEFLLMTKEFEINENCLKIENICGLNYLCFECDENEEILKKVSETSFCMAIYESVGDLLKPICKKNIQFVNPNISSLLKYSGKTNETFTRLMINIGESFLEEKQNINLLDPICGKGTTLFEGLTRGYNCFGIEIADNVVQEISTYLRKFLEKEKYKFDFSKQKFSGENKSFKAQKFLFDIAKNKENKQTKHFEVVAANTIYADKIFKKNHFDLIIGDLPYGVKHSNITHQNQNAFTRNPKELLEKSLDAWRNVLSDKGVMVISWNTFLMKREQFESILKSKGFCLIDDVRLTEFEHRVDQAIKRDFIVAMKDNVV